MVQLGYAPVFHYEKYRSEWAAEEDHSAHLVLDETPIGTFAELEGPPAWIDSMLSRLGVDPGRSSTLSYGKLFLDWKQRTGSPAENLTFAEIAPAEIALR
jgi:adenylate cyclase class 2